MCIRDSAKAGDYDAMVMGWLGFVDPDEYLGEIVGSKGFRLSLIHI